MKNESIKMYENVTINGYTHKCSTLYFNEEGAITYYVGSFYSKQLMDQCLSIFQKGTSVKYNFNYYHTLKKGYVCKFARSKDENTCDGVHSIFYATNENIVRIYKGDNIVDRVYKWIHSNTRCGLVEEWKEYIFNEINSRGLIKKCDGFDFTGKAPEIYIFDKEITTELIRDIKTTGLKQGYIKLNVEENEQISQDMSFVEIIEGKVLPQVEDMDCQYNVGEEISDIFNQDIIMDTKTIHMFPRQKVIAQGLLNAVKNGLNYPIVCCGMGVGKTLISNMLGQAIIREHFKKDTGRIAIMVQGHLIDKFIRECEAAYKVTGIKLNFIVINNYTDVNKIPKKPEGIDIIILPKDRVKRSYLVNHSTNNKYRSLNDNFYDVYNQSKKYSKVVGSVVFTEVSTISKMKYIAIKLEDHFDRKVVTYKPFLNKDGNIEGYYIATTSDSVKNILGKSLNKAYDYKVYKTLEEIEEMLRAVSSEIEKEKIIVGRGVTNPIVCPHCGGVMYDKAQHLFDEEKQLEYKTKNPTGINDMNKHCNAYIKADGTPLTEREIREIRRGNLEYKVVDTKYPYAYLDENDEPIKGKELLNAKRSLKATVLIKVCGEKLVGYKEQKGYRTYDATKYLLKKLGSKSIDVAIIDEAHLYTNASNQGLAFQNVVKLSKVSIPLTGTLTSGRASDLFLFLWRLCPDRMKKFGYEYKELGRFVEHFGRRKKETREYPATYNKSGRVSTTGWKEIPGISPVLYSLLLSNIMVARKIEDLDIKLPELKYFKNDVEMDEDLKCNYENLKSEFVRFMNNYPEVNLGGSYIHSLLAYPDMPIQEPIYRELLGEQLYVAEPRVMDIENRLLNKERKLIETCRKEISEGRGVLLFATYTGEKGVSKRLMDILSNEFQIAELKGSKVKLEKREEWIEKEYQKGTQIILTNPEVVATGLDIIQYPTIYYYEIPTNTKTLRQSECRNLRPTQTKECRIYYSYYRETIQEDLLLLQSSKKASSLALEGVFSDDMLSNMSDCAESIEAQLNKVLKGKIKLKESDLDIIGFESEEVTFTFNENANGNIDVTKSITVNETVEMTLDEVLQLNLFTVDSEFIKKTKKKKAECEGQLGFVF